MKYYATELQRAILSLKEREEVSLDGAFAGLAMKSCLESDVYPQLESMYSSFWNSPPEPDVCHACKVPFCKSCVDTTNCWVNLWEQSFMLRENGWLLQWKLMKRKKMWQHDKRFFIVWPLTIPEFLLWLKMCSLACLSPGSQFLNPLKHRRIWGTSMSKRYFLNHMAFFIPRYTPT